MPVFSPLLFSALAALLALGAPHPYVRGIDPLGTRQPRLTLGVEPLILDVAGDGIELSSAAAGVSFDIDGDGKPEQLGWTKRGSDDAFLWIDRTAEGRVKSGLQLLGGLFDRKRAFETLLAIDRSPGLLDRRLASEAERESDGRLATGDPAFDRLLLWTDLNHNGMSEPVELATLASAGAELFLGYELVNQGDGAGNMVVAVGQARVMNDRGVSVRTQARTVRLARAGQ